MERPDWWARLARPFLIAGLVFLLISLVAASKKGDVAGHFTTTPGTVSEVAAMRDSTGSVRFSAVYQFKDGLGRVWRIHAPATAVRPALEAGQSVVLNYPVGNPGAAELSGKSSSWAPIGAGAFAGAVLLAAGLSGSRRGRIRRRPAP